MSWYALKQDKRRNQAHTKRRSNRKEKQNHHRCKRKPEIKQQRTVHNKQLSKDLFYIHVKKLKVHKGFYTTSEILTEIFASSLKKQNKKKQMKPLKILMWKLMLYECRIALKL